MAARTPRRTKRRLPRQAGHLAGRAPALAVALETICDDLDQIQARYALVGGLAVSTRAEPRLTRDVDLAVDTRDDPAAESIIHGLVARGYRVDARVEQVTVKRLATARLVPPGPAGLIVDLLFASTGIEPEIVRAAERVEVLPGLIVPVARSGHLVAMKLLARDDRTRPQDLDDLRALVPTQTAQERRRVTTAIALIQRRGFARRRDLLASWKALEAPRRKRS